MDKDIAKSNYNEFYSPYKQHRFKWLKDALRHDNFRYGMQYTLQEEADLLALRQAPLPINITAAICETAEAFLTSTSPIITVAPAMSLDKGKREAAKQVASLFREANMSSWYNSLGSLQYDKVIRDFDNVGHGLFCALPQTDDEGNFDVNIKHLFWGNFYPDYSSKDPLYRDSEAQVVSFVVNMKQGLKLVQSYEPEMTEEEFKANIATKDYIDKSPDSGVGSPYTSWAYDEKKVVRVNVVFRLEEQPIYRVIPLKSNIQNVHFKTFLKESLPRTIAELAVNGVVKLEEAKGWYLAEYTNIGAWGNKKVYPVKDLPIVPVVYDHRESPYPHGRVWYIYPIQRALNKFVLLTLLNASLINTMKFLVEDNTIVDEDTWNNFISVPGVRLKWKRTTPNSEPPIPIQGTALPNAALEYPKFLIYIMEYVSGIWSVMQGDTNNAPNTFGGMQSIQSAASMKIKRRLENIDMSLSQLGRVVAGYWQHYAPPNGMSSYIPKFDQVSEFDYNILTEDGNKVNVDPNTDLSTGFKDLRFTTSVNKGYEAASENAQLVNLATQLSVPQLLPLILERMNIPDVSGIIKQIDQTSQLQQTVEQQQKMMQELEKQNKGYMGQIQAMTQEMTNEAFKNKWTRVLERFKGEFKRAGVDINQFENIANQQLFGAMPEVPALTQQPVETKKPGNNGTE